MKPELEQAIEAAGGLPGIRAILGRFYQRLSADPLVGFFFAGRDLDAIADGQLGFLAKALGISDQFTGRHPSVAHDALAPILRGHFDRRLVLLAEELDASEVPMPLCEAWLGVERGMRRVVQRGT